MGKYLEIMKITMKAQIAYRFDVVIGSMMPFIRVLLAYALWKALFSGKTEIGGMTFGMMVTYYIICAFLQRMDQSTGLVWDTAADIREGRFTKYMVRPISPLGHFLSVSFARSLYILAFTLLAVCILGFAFRSNFMMPSSPINLIYALSTGFMGLMILALLSYLTSMLAFKFNDVTGWHLLKTNVVEFLTGTLIPLSLLPEWIQSGMRFLPFYYINYIPASLYLGLRTDEFLRGIITLTIWALCLWGLSVYTYRRFRRVYEGVGN